jgi:hypothetical protein
MSFTGNLGVTHGGVFLLHTVEVNFHRPPDAPLVKQ